MLVGGILVTIAGVVRYTKQTHALRTDAGNPDGGRIRSAGWYVVGTGLIVAVVCCMLLISNLLTD